jgi:hypothetical protein
MANAEFILSGHQPSNNRFKVWLERALTSALSEWQARL